MYNLQVQSQVHMKVWLKVRVNSDFKWQIIKLFWHLHAYKFHHLQCTGKLFWVLQSMYLFFSEVL